MAIMGMTERSARRLRRFSDLYKVIRYVKRRINEGTDSYSMDVGGFSVRFDARKEEP